VIEGKLGEAVATFAYPFAFPEQDQIFVHYLEDVLSNCGFENRVCTALGRASLAKNRYFLPRIPVNSWDDALCLHAKLASGYDWLHWAQTLKKSFDKNLPLMRRAAENDVQRRKLSGRVHP
jgi:hypothetical protein